MIDALLLDLDGTLLGMDLEAFTTAYFALLTKYFSELIPPEEMYRRVWQGTKAMISSDDGTMTNAEVFIASFFTDLDLEVEELMPLFDRFYREQFPALQEMTEPVPGARELVETAKALGLKVVVATNPVFPLVALEQRINWAGLGGLSLDLITSYEIMHFCKPNPRYYQEIADRISISPQRCLMVGNDVEEDLVAQEIGMKTWLVERYRISRGQYQGKPDGEGDLLVLAKKLSQWVSPKTT